MPPAQPQQVTVSTIAENAAVYPGAEVAPPVSPAVKEHDVFISHASEDKEEIVGPLAEALRSKGLDVWYDDFELRVGTSLRRSIDLGLANSRFGVVVLSPAFFTKPWTNYELDGLVTRQNQEGAQTQLILPIWHKVSKAEVIGYSPPLADKVALRTTDSTVEEIAAEIASVVRA
jgi:hypothetical protein